MKKALFLFVISAIIIQGVIACTSVNQYRLFPVGEINEMPFFIELKLMRYCMDESDGPMGGTISKKSYYSWKGTMSLVKYEKDSLVLVQFVDSIDFFEYKCIYENNYGKSEYEKNINTYFIKAKKNADKLRVNTKLKPIK